MWVITFFIGVFFGYLICALISGCETEGESYWRQQYFIEKDKGRKEVIWQNSHNIVISGTASTLNH